MADLSQLSDNELKVYHDLLVQKQTPKNPSDSIPTGKPPVVPRLTGTESIRDVPGNLPMSVMNAGKRLLMGPQMGDASRDSSGKLDLNAGLHPLIDSVKQGSFRPLWDAAIHDPIEAYQNVAGAFHGGKDVAENTAAVPMLKGAMEGAAKESMAPINSRMGIGRYIPFPIPKAAVGAAEGGMVGRYFGHPEIGAAVGGVVPAVKGAFSGARDAASEFKRNVLGQKDLPNPGDFTPNPQSAKRMLDFTPSKNVKGSAPRNKPVGSGEVNTPPSINNFMSDEEGTVNNDEMNNVYRKLAKSSIGGSMTQNEGPTSRPVLPSGRQVPQGMPPGGPETRPVQPVATPGTSPAETPTKAPSAIDTSFTPKDIHDQIAMEGIQKRAADSRAKYEDVYQNVVKGQYTPEQLRNLSPEEHAVIDTRIKNMKHPEEHPSAGKKKYGSGLNPVMIDSLASRLESEQ